MEHRISILFYARKSKKNSDGLAPVYIRITVNGHRLEQSVQRLVDPLQWSAAAGRLKGNTNQVRQLNLYLDTLSAKVLQMERDLVMDGVAVNFSNFREKWLGVTEPARMLLDVFQQHNDQMAALIRAGKDFCPATLDRYNTCRDHVRSFIQWKYRTADIDINRLDYDFVADLEFWLKTLRNCAHNTTLKYISNLKKIVNSCIRKGWLTRDPFAGFKRTKQEVEREALTEIELERINAKSFPTDRLNFVKDIFLFSCYTGLAYADVKKLRRSEIGLGVDGNYWIFTHRQKTDTPSRVPLLPPARAIIEKYRDFPICCDSGNVLPVLSNQKMNAYLKEIADVCGIARNLTFHIARHTFATTVTLSNGVPIESVSKMLGHRNLKTTQHYARVLDRKLSDDMRALQTKFNTENLSQSASHSDMTA
ncbi:site-specific integrase [Puia dinghuensis]|uniref:Transposase n=1 Tax=Puia dinghuensis TaxID=1792502 RepID=A0A8J2UAP6_9BACT|nr:site-specific integrase [Puia dinghuensis]GGA90168.1 transposase [Puia dinghuensis]